MQAFRSIAFAYEIIFKVIYSITCNPLGIGRMAFSAAPLEYECSPS
jgi:hypothetical protein